MHAKNRRDKAIRDAEYAAQTAIRAAIDAFDIEVLDIVTGVVGAPIPTQPAPQGIPIVRPQDLNNDEILRNMIRGFKTYNTTYFRLQ